MSGHTTSRRIRVSLRKAEPDKEPAPREEIPRFVRLLALAHRWHRLIDEGTVESQAEIARMTGLTRARVTQIMRLRWLSPVIQAELVGTGVGESTQGTKYFSSVAEAAPWVRQMWDRS